MTNETETIAGELLIALKGLFEHCAMIHSKWGEGDNTREADAAIAFARAMMSKAENIGNMERG